MPTRVLALLAGLSLLLTATPAHAAADIRRLAGDDRYATAVAVNCCQEDGTTQRVLNTMVIASGEHFADALVGSYLAGLEGGVLLLTSAEDLAPEIVELIEGAPDGEITNVYVMGGTAAIPEEVEAQLADALAANGQPARVTRVAGATAVETAVAVADLRPNQIGGLDASGPWAIVATVGGFADSLAAAPLSYSSSLPILYARPGQLPNETRDALVDLGITNVIIVGGTAVVTNEVASEITELGIEVQRLAGADRQETSVDVAEFLLVNDPEFDGEEFALARGDQFADALAGGSHAGLIGAPILLTKSSTQLGFAAAGWLQRQSGTLAKGWAYGGTGAISDSVLDEAREASEGP